MKKSMDVGEVSDQKCTSQALLDTSPWVFLRGIYAYAIRTKARVIIFIYAIST